MNKHALVLGSIIQIALVLLFITFTDTKTIKHKATIVEHFVEYRPEGPERFERRFSSPDGLAYLYEYETSLTLYVRTKFPPGSFVNIATPDLDLGGRYTDEDGVIALRIHSLKRIGPLICVQDVGQPIYIKLPFDEDYIHDRNK